jgi:hypothetical protein
MSRGTRSNCNLVVVLIALCTVALTGFAADADNSQYLPLRVGKKWVLRSTAVGTPMVFEVIEKTDQGYRIRWDNPWIPSILTIVPRGGKFYVSAVTMNNQSAAMPESTLYWDFTAPKGAMWTNKIGTMTVVARDNIVRVENKTYKDVIEIKENNQFWSFAPGLGFVQFGEGREAFVFDQKASDAPAPTPPSPPRQPTSAPGTPKGLTVGRSGDMPLVGVQANIFANEPLTPTSAHEHYQQSLEAGITFQGFSGTWIDLEPRKGKYSFDKIDFNVSEAARANLPVAYTLSIIDTGKKTVPGGLKDMGWEDPKMQDQLLALIDAIAPHFQGRLRWVMIGNEIDPYFEANSREGQAYAKLFRAAANRFRALLPGVQVSHTITFAGLPMERGVLKPVFDQSDFLSITYYPASADFRFRDPSTVFTDFPKIIEAAQGKKILLQEVGYPSSLLNDSSQEKQAQFYSNVFSQLRANGGKFMGANFLFMSDFSDAVVDDLVKYYNAPGAARFRAFLQTLGMFDGQGQPKKSWKVFQQEANKMKS